MRVTPGGPGVGLLFAVLALPASDILHAQGQSAPVDPNIVVHAPPEPPAPTPPPVAAATTAGPEIKGVITARNGDKMKVTAADGTSTVIALDDETRIKAAVGLFGTFPPSLTADSLLNGLPVTVKTLQEAMAWWRRRSASTTATSRPRR